MCVIALAGLAIYINISSIQTNSLNLKLPDKSTAIKPNTLPVSVNVDGQLFYKKTPVNIDELKKRIQQDIEKFEDQKKATIIITPEENTPVEHIVSIMDMALKMEIGAVLANK